MVHFDQKWNPPTGFATLGEIQWFLRFYRLPTPAGPQRYVGTEKCNRKNASVAKISN